MNTRDLTPPTYEGLIVPRLFAPEFLGALISDAASKGYKAHKIPYGSYAARNKFLEIKQLVQTGYRFSPSAAMYIGNKAIYLENGTTETLAEGTFSLNAVEAGCVESGLRMQGESLLRSSVWNADAYHSDISISQSRRKQRMADYIHTALMDSQVEPVQLDDTRALILRPSANC